MRRVLQSPFVRLLREALIVLFDNDPLRLAGATAFFTTFALPPILGIIIQVLGIIFSRRTISTQVFGRLSDTIGKESVRTLMQTLHSFVKLAQNPFITIFGFVFFMFVSTTLLMVVKNSLNQLWKIRMSGNRRIWMNVKSRFYSIAVILFAGVLFMASLVLETLQALLGRYIEHLWPLLAALLDTVLNQALSMLIVTLWFAMLFRYLPDGRPTWRVAFSGALLTGLLFTIGKLILRSLLVYSNINTIYGASTSIVLLLLFVFYSALILYYGAAFTKVLGMYIGQPIAPLPHAVHYKLVKVDLDQSGERKSGRAESAERKSERN
jgi:membrane protein